MNNCDSRLICRSASPAGLERLSLHWSRVSAGARRVPTRQQGLSLIELMVAITIGLLLLAGLTTLFVSSSRSFAENERASRQNENGRYAMNLLSEDVRHAGFYGEAGDLTKLPGTNNPAAPALPAGLPDPCVTDVPSLWTALSLPIQGIDNVAGGTKPSCQPEIVPGTDVIVIRRATTTTTTLAAAQATDAGGYYTQTSFCNAATTVFKLDKNNDTTAPYQLDLTGKDCTAKSGVRNYHVDLYFISPCSVATGAGGACAASDPPLPTLKRAELRTAGFTVVPLVEGIENMQIEYGLDPDGDGAPNSYSSSPATVANWASVVSVRLYMLARNIDPTTGYTDTKTYQLGGTNVTPGGPFKRHVFTQLVRLVNIGQHKETPL